MMYDFEKSAQFFGIKRNICKTSQKLILWGFCFLNAGNWRVKLDKQANVALS